MGPTKSLFKKIQIFFFKIKVKFSKISQTLRYKLYFKFTDYLKIQVDPYKQTYNPISPTGNLSLLNPSISNSSFFSSRKRQSHML